ncbi:uncharacterized protein V1518DRAFT_224174 [Limtongia smithiae]|uniref:uncharacterized protein n=1 Tax=Limtongia smithiae TaxID=1125753 RepID=UPI0034CF8886
MFTHVSGCKQVASAPPSPFGQSLVITSIREARRHVWLTATRTLSFPVPEFALGIFTIVEKVLELTLRKLLQPDGFRILVRTTAERETRRIAAWKTAINAQPLGGDAICLHVRLLFTLLESFSLPATPTGRMTQALEVGI